MIVPRHEMRDRVACLIAMLGHRRPPVADAPAVEASPGSEAAEVEAEAPVEAPGPEAGDD